MGTYQQFENAFGITLDDNQYVRLEFTDEMWNQIKPSLTNDGKHDWLIGRGFGDSEANKESSWLATIEHGFLASRTGNTVYLILK